MEHGWDFVRKHVFRDQVTHRVALHAFTADRLIVPVARSAILNCVQLQSSNLAGTNRSYGSMRVMVRSCCLHSCQGLRWALEVLDCFEAASDVSCPKCPWLRSCWCVYIAEICTSCWCVNECGCENWNCRNQVKLTELYSHVRARGFFWKKQWIFRNILHQNNSFFEKSDRRQKIRKVNISLEKIAPKFSNLNDSLRAHERRISSTYNTSVKTTWSFGASSSNLTDESGFSDICFSTTHWYL